MIFWVQIFCLFHLCMTDQYACLGNEVHHFGYPEFDTCLCMRLWVLTLCGMCVFSCPISRGRASSCVEGEGGCQCLYPVVYLFAPGSRRAFAHFLNNKHCWLLTKALVPVSPKSGDLEVPVVYRSIPGALPVAQRP